jgi:hypothetical protein
MSRMSSPVLVSPGPANIKSMRRSDHTMNQPSQFLPTHGCIVLLRKLQYIYKIAPPIILH